MAQLSTIVSSILRDMVLAQHEANLYAMNLSEVYKTTGKLESISLPAVALGEIEFELRYGVTESPDAGQQYEINYPEIGKTFDTLSSTLARTIVDCVINTVKESAIDDGSLNVNLVEKLARKPSLKHDFCTFLSHKINIALRNSLTDILNEDGTLNGEIILNEVLETSTEVFLYHKELASLFGFAQGEKLRMKAKEDIQTDLANLLPKLLKDINLNRKRLIPSMEVTVDSEMLSKLPEESIQALRFKVSPKSIRLYANDTE